MGFIADLPLGLVALAIFCLRIVDVTLGTVRTLAIVEGRIAWAVALGFFEIMVWITAVAQVILRINDSLLLAVAYAGGFAAGNAAGILIERWIGAGVAGLRIISRAAGPEIAAVVRELGQAATTFTGEGRDGPVTLIYVVCPRRRLPALLAASQAVDPDLYFVVERINAASARPLTLVPPTGWRAILKKK